MAAGKVKNVAGQPHFQGTHPTMFRRFSLRTLLIITTLAALLFGYIVWFEAPSYNPRQRQQEYLVEQVTNGGNGFDVSVSWEELPKPPLAQLLGRKPGRRIRSLHIGLSTESGADEEEIERIFQLIDADPTHLKVCLSVQGNARNLEKTPRLQIPSNTDWLRLDGVLIDERLLSAIERHKSVNCIYVGDSAFETNDLAEANRKLFRALSPKASQVYLGYGKFSAEGVIEIGMLQNVAQVSVNSCKFVGEDGTATKRLPAEMIPLSAKSLSFYRQELDTKCLERLKKCDRLECLYLGGCTFEADDLNQELLELLEAMPPGMKDIQLRDVNLETRHIEALTRYQELRRLEIEHYGPAPSIETIAQLRDVVIIFTLEADDSLGWAKGLVQKPFPGHLRFRFRGEAPDEVMEMLMKAKERNSLSFEFDMLSIEAMDPQRRREFIREAILREAVQSPVGQ